MDLSRSRGGVEEETPGWVKGTEKRKKVPRLADIELTMGPIDSPEGFEREVGLAGASVCHVAAHRDSRHRINRLTIIEWTIAAGEPLLLAKMASRSRGSRAPLPRC
jgi:hypothetical protein